MPLVQALGLSLTGDFWQFGIAARHLVLPAITLGLPSAALVARLTRSAMLEVLGAQPPTPEWGAMLSRGREFLRFAPHIPTYPGLAIFITVIGFNFIGDGLRDLFDPRLKV